MANTKQLEANIRGLLLAIKAGAILAAVKATIEPTSLESGGKLNPARGLPGGSGINPAKSDNQPVTKTAAGDDVNMFIPIAKADAEKQEVTGVVLQPEVTDAQGDIISEAVIEKAAGDFLAGFNKNSTLGLMHKAFNKNFELRQSFIAPSDMVISNKTVKKGAWVMIVKVKDAKIWKAIKDGKITGFSIGGKAKVQQLAA